MCDGHTEFESNNGHLYWTVKGDSLMECRRNFRNEMGWYRGGDVNIDSAGKDGDEFFICFHKYNPMLAYVGYIR